MARILAAAAAGAAVLLAGQVFAAQGVQLAAVKGEVLVSRDGKLVKAAPGALKPGDRVLARADGRARVTYADGCAVTLKPSAMITVADASPCAGGAGLVSATTGAPAQATQQQGMTALQWAGVGLTVVVLGVGLAAAADDLPDSP